jgi:hypothetical protein
MILARHPWKFALQRSSYDIADFEKAITAITQASPAVVTSASHGITEGQGMYLWGISGMTDLNLGHFIATNVTANTLELYKLDRATKVDSSSYSAYSSGGYLRLKPVSEYEYTFKLPTDCLRVHKVYGDDYKWTVESGHLLIDASEVAIKWIQEITDVSKFPAPFISALATQWAADLIEALKSDTKKKALLLEELETIVLPEARFLNAIEKYPKDDDRRTKRSTNVGWQKSGR